MAGDPDFYAAALAGLQAGAPGMSEISRQALARNISLRCKDAIRSAGTGRSEAEAAGKSGLSNAELEAEALRYQAIAAEQGSTIMRLRIAMKLLTESGHGGAIHTARKWFAAGGTGPIPWPGGALFEAWAVEQGYSEVDGCVGFRMTASVLPVQTAGGAGE